VRLTRCYFTFNLIWSFTYQSCHSMPSTPVAQQASEGLTSHSSACNDYEEDSIPSSPSSSCSSHTSHSTCAEDEYTRPHHSVINLPPKGVRFLLDVDSTDCTGQIVVMPGDATAEKPKLGPPSRWTKYQLDMLNVEYHPRMAYDFPFDVVEMSEMSYEARGRTRLPYV
jgi:hypothetical protein